MRNVKVVVWGFGAMGSGIARMLVGKKGVEIVGVLDKNPKNVGRSMYDCLEIDRAGRPDVTVRGNENEVIRPFGCDAVLMATDSFVTRAYDKIKFCVERGINVVCTAEEMAYPQAQHPDYAEKIDKLAKKHGVTVLGTGINPGFVLDYLILALSGTCDKVDSIRAKRINDLSPFGIAVMEEQGVGITPDEFEKRVDSGAFAGHVGFPESIAMIAKGLGIGITKVEQTKAPIVSGVHRQTPYAKVEPGTVAGVRQQGYGYAGDKLFIHLDHPQQICPKLENVETGDYITIRGNTDVNMAITPEIPGGTGTVAMCVNMLPHVINAKPGLTNMLELPVPHAVEGDMRDMVNPEKLKNGNFQKGDYVQIYSIVLPAGRRAPQVPSDTAELPLEMWVKGFLCEDSELGSEATVRTMAGRKVKGTLIKSAPAYTHNFGEFVPELLKIRRQVAEIRNGGRNDE